MLEINQISVFKKNLDLIGAMTENPEASISKLGNKVNKDKSTISKAMNELEMLGIVDTKKQGKEKLCKVKIMWEEKYNYYKKMESALDENLEKKIKDFVAKFKKEHNGYNPKSEEIGIAVGRNPTDSIFLTILYSLANEMGWYDPTQEEIKNATRGIYPDLIQISSQEKKGIIKKGNQSPS